LIYGIGGIVTIVVVVCVTIWARRYISKNDFSTLFTASINRAIKQAMAEVEQKDQEKGSINYEQTPKAE
jgi:hypothetical protein